jgi:hypothetical protein
MFDTGDLNECCHGTDADGARVDFMQHDNTQISHGG